MRKKRSRKRLTVASEQMGGIPAPAPPYQVVPQPAPQPVPEPSGVIQQASNLQQQINNQISRIVNPLAKQVNNLVKSFSVQETLESDPTGLIELATETAFLLDDAWKATIINAQGLLGLDVEDQKRIIKLGEVGDRSCDDSKLKMTIEFPGIFREFNACIDIDTFQELGKQIAERPTEPIGNFIGCAFSENIIKPVDTSIVTMKNAVANVIKNVQKPADIVGNLQMHGSFIVNTIADGFSGRYLMGTPDKWADMLACFQAKTKGLNFETVGVRKAVRNILDPKWLRGEKTEKTYSSKPIKPKACNF